MNFERILNAVTLDRILPDNTKQVSVVSIIRGTGFGRSFEEAEMDAAKDAAGNIARVLYGDKGHQLIEKLERQIVSYDSVSALNNLRKLTKFEYKPVGKDWRIGEPR